MNIYGQFDAVIYLQSTAIFGDENDIVSVVD